MNKKAILLLNIFIGIFFISFLPLNAVGQGNNEIHQSQNFDLEFNQKWKDPTPSENKAEITDINTFVDGLNADDFLASELTGYYGSEVPSNTILKYYYRVRLTRIEVYKDGDGSILGAGDMFLRGWINQQIDDDMDQTKNWTYELGQFNDGESANFDQILFEGWANCLHFWIELYDDDAGSVDTFGTWEENWYQPTSNVSTYVYYDIYSDDNKDANLTITFDVMDGPENFTADDLLEAYKPYLYSDVETIYDDPAEYVFGRVIEGYDSKIDGVGTCLQYLYYFPYEYTGSDVFVHYWDWEMILIYLDLNAGGSYFPYRLVWDNGYYFTASQDWIDGQDYRIYEKNATEGTFSTDVDFFEPLKPLLGDSREMDCKMYNLSSIWTTDFEKWGYFEYGLPSFQATIETSYHQFDLGDAGGTDPVDMNRNYDVLSLDLATIKSAYKSLNDSFNGGVHSIGGVYTPNFAPFSWDISQPFTYPYLLNNYPKLACDINAFNGASDSKSGSISVDKEIEMTINCPAMLTIDMPYDIKPGEDFSGDLNVLLNQSSAKIQFDVYMNITVEVDTFFFSKEWEIIVNETIGFDAETNELEVFGASINLDFTGEEELTIENRDLGEFVSVGGDITPNLIGEMVSAEINISLSTILKYFITGYEWIVDLLVDDLGLIINPTLDGYMQMDIYSNTQKIVEDQQFTAENTTIPISLTAPEGSSESWTFSIDDLSYGVQFAVDWGIDLEWAILPGLVLDDQTWMLGTWPEIDIEIAEGSSSLDEVAEYEYNSGSEEWRMNYAYDSVKIDPPPSGNPQINGFAGIGIVSLLGICIVLFRVKKRGVN